MNKEIKRKSYSSEELITFLRQFLIKNGRVPNTRELDSTTCYPSAGVFRRVFGSLRKSFDEAKIDVGQEFRTFYSKDDLIAYLIKFVNEFKKLPTVRDMDKAKGYPSATVFRLKFGSLRKAIEATNIHIPNYYRRTGVSIVSWTHFS
ncbi:homing endonuclease associated repeat-containing protein [Peribacillus butanolivorans]|uniref:homing endonuclease associated repeat-containing protein n=1 Tax=Peribacillus butanolivorans TaxID=421767 RepID=UPI0036DCDB2B